jgi:hypothetical protein
VFVLGDLLGLTGVGFGLCLFSVAKRRDDTSGDLGDLQGLTGIVLTPVCFLGPPGTYRDWFDSLFVFGMLVPSGIRVPSGTPEL